jgi:hypothetical protein
MPLPPIYHHRRNLLDPFPEAGTEPIGDMIADPIYDPVTNPGQFSAGQEGGQAAQPDAGQSSWASPVGA